MRPVGEVNRALLDAALMLSGPEGGPTLRELAARACVGQQAAANTVKNMTRAGALKVVRKRKVAHSSRPVAEYAPGDRANIAPPPGDEVLRLNDVLQMFAHRVTAGEA